MGWFRDNIWKRFFTEHHKANDLYPVGGKGLSQRFMEMFGLYLDEQIVEPIDMLLPNTISPQSIINNLLPYREQERGVDLVYDNTLTRRRQILQYFIRISQLKGSKRGYEVCFKLMAFENLIIESVDVITYFANPLPAAGCNACYEYDVILEGSLLLLQPFHVDAFFNIVAYNEPINCKIRFMIYNDFYLVKDFVTFFFDDVPPLPAAKEGRSPNLFLDNSRNPAFSASFVDASGHLVLSGTDEQYYQFDDTYFGNMGHILFIKDTPVSYGFFNSLAPTDISSASFRANWTAKAGAVNYKLIVGKNRNNSNDIITERVAEVDLPSSQTDYLVVGLEANTAYYYQVRAYNAEGQEAFSSVQSLITLQGVGTPTALAALPISPTQFIARWQRVSGATAYELDIAEDNTFSTGLQTFAVLNINQYSISKPTGTYYARVRAKIDKRNGYYPIPVSVSANSNTIAITI